MNFLFLLFITLLIPQLQGIENPRAVETAQKTCQIILEKNPNPTKTLGLTSQELFEIALYIETTLKFEPPSKKVYLRKEHTGLARTIEYDPKSNNYFIHLKTHGIAKLGSGYHKRVTRSLLYSNTNPQIVANSIIPTKKNNEIKLVKQLKNIPGVCETIAVSHHKKTSGKNVTSIVTKLYNSGSISGFTKAHKSLSKKEKLVVCRDILRGLENLHKKNIIHRDLHGSNILLHENNNKMTAVLIDFGQSQPPAVAIEKAPRIQAAREYNPPEVFSLDRSIIDPKKVDSYALGLCLYKFYFETAPEWIKKEEFQNIRSWTSDEKALFEKTLFTRIEQALQNRKEMTQSKNNEYKKFEKVLLKMCHPLPEKRYSAAKARKKLDKQLSLSRNS